jgi:DNA ligase-1
MEFKPMGAATLDDVADIQFPVYVSPKLDGIRCSVRNGVAYSKKMKPLPNIWLQELVSRAGVYDGLDFEVVVGSPTAPDVWNKSQSFAMSKLIPAALIDVDVHFFVFDDHTDPTLPRKDRLARAAERADKLLHCTFVRHHVCKDSLQVLRIEEQYVEKGYEGIMLSSPKVPYKFGRSTVREQGLMKFKRFADAEAIVLACEEELHNANEQKISELGTKKRSSHKANKHGKGTLGAFKVQDLETGVVFSVGGGISTADRARFWPMRDKLVGKIITYKSQKTEVAGGMPRFPSFKGFREDV